MCAADGLTEKLDEIASAWTKLERDQIGLPSMEQIMVADGQSETEYTNFPSLTNAWLYSWDNWGDTVYGYWTSSPHESISFSAWRVGYSGLVDSSDEVNYAYGHGVRPVITLKI